jgi:hypothetical protein
MTKKDYRGSHNLTIPAPIQNKKHGIDKQAKVIPLPVAERSCLMSLPFEKTMHIKEILDFMRENRLYPEDPSQIAKNKIRI